MTTRSLFPLAVWDRCDDAEADAALVAWGHYLGACDRPFALQSFALRLDGAIVAVAVSASIVSTTVEGLSRFEVVELARLCAHPEHRDLTRVALRLWRKAAALEWVGEYRDSWPVVRAYVSYSGERHTGDIYRFDGWRRVGSRRRGSKGGGTWTAKRKDSEDKDLWIYSLAEGGAL